MSDPQTLPEPDYPEGRKGISLIWLMPVLAIVIALGVAWQSFQDRGPLIYVTFPSAAGIEVDKTGLRYRDVQVGIVESIAFGDDLQSVDVAIRIDKEMGPFIDRGARFWLVQPEVSARGITGLDTVLSGVYIEGSWDGTAGTAQDRFEAQPNAPIARAGETGTTVLLRTDDGRQLAANAPVLFNGIEVGRLGEPRLSTDGTTVTIEAFISSPHDQRLTSATRFWDSSGFSISLGAGGVSVNVDSLAALVEGGISFGTLVSGGNPITPGQIYTIFASEDAARASVFDGDLDAGFDLGILLSNDVQGLAAGAAVRFRGIKVGEVTDISGFLPPDDPDEPVRPLASLSISPARLGITGAASSRQVLDALEVRVAQGLRARLASEGLLGRTVVVELVELPDAAPAEIDAETAFVPLLPTVAPNLEAGEDSIDGLVQRVSDLPIEDLLTSAIALMDSVTAIASDPETRALPSEARGLLADTRSRISGPELDAILADLQQAAGGLQSIVTEVETSEGIPSLLAALERSDAIATDLAETAARLPDLSDQVAELLDGVNALPLESVVSDAGSVIARLDTVLSDDAVPGILPTLARTLTDAEAAVADLRSVAQDVQGSDGISTLLAALERSGEVMDDLARATDNLPALSDQARSILAEINALPLAGLTDTAGAVIARLNTVLADESVTQLAPALAASLTEARAVLSDLRASGVVAQLNETLLSAETLTNDLTDYVAPLPEIIADAGAVVDQISDLPLNQLTQSANDAIVRIETILNAPGIQDIPTALSAALTEVQAALEELRAGGAVASLNATLANANSALAAVDQAAQSFPGLTRRLTTIAADLDALIATYTDRSRFNSELTETVRAAGDAAKALRSLARTIERNPSAVLTGR